jgi:hypothetical protein
MSGESNSEGRARVVMTDRGDQETVEAQCIILRDESGRVRGRWSADFGQTSLVLFGADGWRMMLIVHNEVAYIILYAHENDPRIQMLVDKRGTPHVRRYWWKRFIPRWNGYYPGETAEG